MLRHRFPTLKAEVLSFHTCRVMGISFIRRYLFADVTMKTRHKQHASSLTTVSTQTGVSAITQLRQSLLALRIRVCATNVSALPAACPATTEELRTSIQEEIVAISRKGQRKAMSNLLSQRIKVMRVTKSPVRHYFQDKEHLCICSEYRKYFDTLRYSFLLLLSLLLKHKVFQHLLLHSRCNFIYVNHS
jgi:hypothetical protein